MRNRKLTAAMLMALATPSVYAAGFALIEQSASGQGLSYAGAAASAEDASVMWFNPAGMTEISGREAIFAGHLMCQNLNLVMKVLIIQRLVMRPVSGDDDNGATEWLCTEPCS